MGRAITQDCRRDRLACRRSRSLLVHCEPPQSAISKRVPSARHHRTGLELGNLLPHLYTETTETWGVATVAKATCGSVGQKPAAGGQGGSVCGDGQRGQDRTGRRACGGRVAKRHATNDLKGFWLVVQSPHRTIATVFDCQTMHFSIAIYNGESASRLTRLIEPKRDTQNHRPALRYLGESGLRVRHGYAARWR
jgi:hypothetical protein